MERIIDRAIVLAVQHYGDGGALTLLTERGTVYARMKPKAKLFNLFSLVEYRGSSLSLHKMREVECTLIDDFSSLRAPHRRFQAALSLRSLLLKSGIPPDGYHLLLAHLDLLQTTDEETTIILSFLVKLLALNGLLPPQEMICDHCGRKISRFSLHENSFLCWEESPKNGLFLEESDQQELHHYLKADREVLLRQPPPSQKLFNQAKALFLQLMNRS